jgi:hypothetical protein
MQPLKGGRYVPNFDQGHRWIMLAGSQPGRKSHVLFLLGWMIAPGLNATVDVQYRRIDEEVVA